jgi:hypothetical protein
MSPILPSLKTEVLIVLIRHLNNRGIAWIIFWSTILITTALIAEPHFAFREGYKCSACHVNKTGGGKRTADFGAIFTQTYFTPLWQKATENAQDFSTDLNEFISIGGDFIAVNETQFSVDDKLKANGTTTNYARDTQNSFAIDSGSFYLEAQLVPNTLSFYLDETVAPGGASSREAFILIQNLPHQSYIKAGRMLLPYGIRVWDDETFIRQVTGFNYDNQDMGVELGIEPGNLSLSLALSNGTQGSRDDNTGKQISSVGSLFLPNIILGGSFSYNKSRGIENTLAGPFAALALGAVTLQGEVDWIKSSSSTLDQTQFVAYGSLEYWMKESINLRLAYDFLNPFDTLEEDERSRVTLGFDAYLTPFLSASAYYKMKQSIPQDIRGNADALTVGLHGFF